jgi:hypothetical protein
MTTMFTYNGPRFFLSEHNCHFVNLLSFSNKNTFLSQLEINYVRDTIGNSPKLEIIGLS